MSAVIFTGPTLSAADAMRVLEADYLPPAAEGDVYRVARQGPQVIGIIDGYFERVPAVWHKEILWAMSQGIHVFGAASMGALRAAELEAFGMEGVGSIFEAFRDGALEDDDEVAVAHAGAEFDFRPGSEAMVDIRHTLGLALDAGVIRHKTRARIEAAAKARFYPDRRYEPILSGAPGAIASPEELDALKSWLPQGRASLKRADAIAMLRVIKKRLSDGLEPKQVQYTLENSSMWESASRLAGNAAGSGPVLLDSVLEELRLDEQRLAQVQQAAMLRVLAIKQSHVQGLSDAGAQAATTAARFWRRHRVDDAKTRRAWMSDNHLDEARLARLLDDETRVEWIQGIAARDSSGYVLDQLRVSGDYARLADRATSKQRWLASRGLESPSYEDVGLDANGLMAWYFEGRLGRPVPHDLDRYSRELGLKGRAALERIVAREYCYQKGEAVTAAT